MDLAKDTFSEDESRSWRSSHTDEGAGLEAQLEVAVAYGIKTIRIRRYALEMPRVRY